MELNDRIIKLVQESLPGIQATEFKKYIEQSEVNIKKIESLEGEKKALVDTNNVHLKQINEFLALKNEKEFNDKQKAANEADARKNAEDARNLELTVLKNRLADKDNLLNKVYEWNAILVKNPRAIEILNQSTFESQQPYPGPGGNYIYPPAISKTSTEAREKIETKESGSPQSIADTEG